MSIFIGEIVKKDGFFVPILSSNEGLCLTSQQWKTTRISWYAYSLTTLLQRPGFPYVFDIYKDLVCPGFAILNATNLSVNAKGKIEYRSTDGALMRLGIEQLAIWLQALKPDAIVWPFAPNYLLDLGFLPSQILVPTAEENDTIVCAQIRGNQQWFISNQPAAYGYQGKFLVSDQVLQILDEVYQDDLNLLAPNCDCDSCAQGFTRAYLHHLMAHTPLLAQRYIILHNMRQTQHAYR
jgi:queuine tRNA-ribosyltransferase